MAELHALIRSAPTVARLPRARRAAATVAALLSGAATISVPRDGLAKDAHVDTSAELVTALATASAGDVVTMRTGVYLLDASLRIPDGVTLHGGGAEEGADADPDAFAGAGAATLRAADTFYGDLVVLGDGAALRQLRIEQWPPPDGRKEFGNGVVVASRSAGDRVRARIERCDIASNGTYGGNAQGPTGRAVLVVTRHPPGDPQHRFAQVELLIERTAIRAPRGNALFANNFASGAGVRVEVRQSLVEGFIAVSGGTSRGQLVTGSTTRYTSEDTRYRRVDGGFDRFGWQLFGASGTPLPGGDRSIGGGDGNRLLFESRRDRLEGFRTAVLASGYRRVADFSAAGNDNRIELRMLGTSIRSSGDGAADLVLRGGAADPGPQSEPRFAPGQRNVVRAELEGVTGSGARANRYLDCDCLAGSADAADGNRVLIEGDAQAFAESNPSVQPPPPGPLFGRPLR